MSTSDDLERWRHHWQTAPADADDEEIARALKARVARQTRRLTLGMIVPVFVTVVVGGGLILRAISVREPVAVVAAIEGWLFILVTWAGSLWIARGTWRPLGETTADFLDLSIRRCRANLKAILLAVALYIAQLVVVVLIAMSDPSAGLGTALRSWPMLVVGGIGLPALLLGGFAYTRRQRGQLEQLLALRRQLEG